MKKNALLGLLAIIFALVEVTLWFWKQPQFSVPTASQACKSKENVGQIFFDKDNTMFVFCKNDGKTHEIVKDTDGY